LWHLATYQERKEVLRLAINKITVQATSEIVEAIIHWKGGQKQPCKMFKRRGRYQLVKQLHTQGYNSKEIADRLVQGRTSTGQTWKIKESMVYLMLRKLKLDPHRFSSKYRFARQIARELYERYQDLDQTAAELNKRGVKTLFDEEWTPRILRMIIKPQNQKKVYFEALARKACEEINHLTMTDQVTSDELNRRKIPRYNRQPWNPRAVNRLRYRIRRDGRNNDTKPIVENLHSPRP
jgi:hypothetical protein